ncbi:nuclear transport factor 2 family protein [Paraburkholderia bonniea]|uniref:nuclear transport factor 2 family protein n=1 Tax=Paraburkholderia bonniea TaxID=2152891 RepID=UPI001291B9A6|nr:nuclear transport factor 2 family protein [Paraburkholderia bonniea]WJF89729.1 nuclear transport factor 2 family protein [Paraburkholderia bonniea]WJF93043.1 nuclear transport factor 2 family protein [Paraburkholderia bonniea]
MPRFAHIFEAAADTLYAWYQAISEANIDRLMSLWIDEEFASFICSSGEHLHGLEQIRAGLLVQLEAMPTVIEPLDIRVYDSLGTVVYVIAEAHSSPGQSAPAMLVFSTYVMVQERGEWRIAHIHSSPVPEATAQQLMQKLRRGQDALH